MSKLFATLLAAVFAAATVTPVIAQDKKDAPKAEVITKDEERMFFERYNQQHLNISEEPVNIQPVE